MDHEIEGLPRRIRRHIGVLGARPARPIGVVERHHVEFLEQVDLGQVAQSDVEGRDGVFQMRQRPLVLGGACLIGGYLWAWIRRTPSPVPQELRDFHRQEQLARAWEEKKPYLSSRWRWPDRFNP